MARLLSVAALSVIVAFMPMSASAQRFLKKDAAGWIADLSSDSSEATRRSAAFALGKMGVFAVDALPHLRRALGQDASAKVRDAAAFALGEIVRDCLRAAAADARYQAQAAKALDPQLTSLLSKSLKDEAWSVRRSAAFALGCLEKDAAPAREPLEAALRDASPPVRQNAAWALGRLGPDAIPKLREALTDNDPYVKRDAVQALNLFDPAPLRPALDDLLRLCRDDNSEVRRATVAALIRVVGPEDHKAAAPPLRAVLADPDEEIRTNAALALSNIGGAEAAPAISVLVTALRRGELETRRQAAAALGNIGPESARALPDLLNAMKDKDTELRTNATMAIGAIGAAAEKAVPAIVSVLVDAKDLPEPRLAAAVALSRIGDVPAAIDAAPRLLGLVSDAQDDGQVRWRAVWALRVHNVNLRKMPGVYPAFAKVLKEPTTKSNRMLRYDCAYMLGVLQRAEAPNDVLDVLSEFLKDSEVQVYDTTKATVQNTGVETGPGVATVKEIGQGDGRVLALQALAEIGAARVAARPDIVRQLRTLADDAKTFGELRTKCAALLRAAGK